MVKFAIFLVYAGLAVLTVATIYFEIQDAKRRKNKNNNKK